MSGEQENGSVTQKSRLEQSMTQKRSLADDTMSTSGLRASQSEGSPDDLPHLQHRSSEPEQRRVCRIISYGHANGPLVSKPNFRFDVRNLPNPPRKLRQAFTGRHARLREAIFGNPDASGTLGDMKTGIEKVLEEVEQQGANGSGDGVVRGVCCERGQHRSVAAVEELGGMIRREDWKIIIDHRDLGQKRKGRKESRRSKQKVTGKGMAYELGETDDG